MGLDFDALGLLVDTFRLSAGSDDFRGLGLDSEPVALCFVLAMGGSRSPSLGRIPMRTARLSWNPPKLDLSGSSLKLPMSCMSRKNPPASVIAVISRDGSVRRSIGPSGPAGPGRRLDRRDGGRTGPAGEPPGGSGSVGTGRGQDGRGTAAGGPVRRPAARGRRDGGRDASGGQGWGRGWLGLCQAVQRRLFAPSSAAGTRRETGTAGRRDDRVFLDQIGEVEHGQCQFC
jgi:hypothetical protein